MEDLKKKMSADMNDKEIVFSKSIKAGKRIYYLDVKKNRKDEMFLAITESKKVITGEGDDSQVSFEKHKIFLYREDFQKFMAGLEEAVNFIECSDANEYIARLNIEADEENERKAGKRIYYLDVKKNRKDEMFLAITESKKVITGEGDDSQVSFEKHKIFLYREDFQKFMAGLEEAVNFIECSDANEYIARLNIEADEENERKAIEEARENKLESEIKIDIDF